MVPAMTRLHELAQRAAESLARNGRQLVLAESCTAGLVAATLGGVPGVSRHLCGSAVVYQEATKSAWLDVPESLLASAGAVSAEVAAALASGALARTPHADLAAAVTGHLGPHAPAYLDGVVYVAMEFRGTEAFVTRHQLATPSEADAVASRRARQAEAAALVLERILAAANAG